MIFRFIIIFFLSILVSNVYADNLDYQMMPGKYSLQFVITDSQESYPVSMDIEVNDIGLIKHGSVNYPTYDCKANLIKSSQKKFTLAFYEKMIFGYDTCSPSMYNLKLNPLSFFNPGSKQYFNLLVFDGEEYPKLEIKEYNYIPSKYGGYRINKQIKHINQILDSHDSNFIRDYIKLSNMETFKNKARKKLTLLVNLEDRKYEKLIDTKSIESFESYIKEFPGSKHISKAKNTIAKIKKEQLIASYRKQATPESYYKAYILSNDDKDIEQLLVHMNNLTRLKEFTSRYQGLLSHSLIKNRFIKLYRQEQSLEGYLKAFEITKSSNDLNEVLSFSNTIEQLEYFLNTYDKQGYDNIITDAKAKLLLKYRALNNFKGYLAAYELSSDAVDGKNALKNAKNSEEKANIEKLAFKNVKYTDGFVNIEISTQQPSFRKNNGEGMFSQSTQYGYMSVNGNIKVEFNREKLPFEMKFGEYKVTVDLKLTIPRNKQVRSNWVGNHDTRSDNVQTTSIRLYLQPPFKESNKSFFFSDKTFVYFDRGVQGGFTAIWPADYPYVEVTSITVSYNKQSITYNKPLDIDFDKLNNYSNSINYPKAYVSNVYNKGIDWINNFANNKIGQYKSYKSSSYNTTSSSTPSSTSKTNSSHLKSSASKTGIKKYYDGGYNMSNGSPIYIVKCNNGKEISVGKKSDGFWYSGGTFNTGENYKNLSIEKFAQKYCN